MDSFDEELLAMEAIFPDCVFRDPQESRQLLIYPYPDTIAKHISLRLHFPIEYPDIPPYKSDCNGVSDSLVQEIIETSWTPGELCTFAIVDKLRGLLEDAREEPNRNAQPSTGSLKFLDNQVRNDRLDVRFEFFISPPIIDRKSTFVGRAIGVSSRAEAHSALQWLKNSDKKVARATHNIVAWRLVENGVLMQGIRKNP